MGRIDDLRVGELAFHFDNAPFDEALPFLGGIVFGVFGQISVRTRLLDGGDHLGPLHRLELMQFAAQQFGALHGQWNLVHHSEPLRFLSWPVDYSLACNSCNE